LVTVIIFKNSTRISLKNHRFSSHKNGSVEQIIKYGKDSAIQFGNLQVFPQKEMQLE
jgi:hypothetical protein